MYVRSFDLFITAKLKLEKLSAGSREFQALNKTFFDSIFSRNAITKSYFVDEIYEIYSPGLETKVGWETNDKDGGSILSFSSNVK